MNLHEFRELLTLVTTSDTGFLNFISYKKESSGIFNHVAVSSAISILFWRCEQCCVDLESSFVESSLRRMSEYHFDIPTASDWFQIRGDCWSWVSDRGITAESREPQTIQQQHTTNYEWVVNRHEWFSLKYASDLDTQLLEHTSRQRPFAAYITS